MKIKMPSIEEQEKTIKKTGIKPLKSKKLRTSFELSEEVNRFLESEANSREIPPSELLRQIIEETEIEIERHKKRLKNLTVYQSHMDKLEQISTDLVPDSWKGKRGGNKSATVEILIKEYMRKI